MRRRSLTVIAILFCLAVVLLALLFEIKLFPIVESLAVAEGKNLATSTVNQVILDVLSENDGEGLITLERGEGGEIVSLTTDTSRVNLIKALVSCEIEKRLGDEAEELRIPLGNLTGMKLMSGRGPDISVRTLPVRSVVTDIGSIFIESGINQTWHRVVLEVEVDFGVMVLSHSIDCRVTDTVVLSDTVIVGRVPDAYTDINKIGDELLGDIVDFSASSN